MSRRIYFDPADLREEPDLAERQQAYEDHLAEQRLDVDWSDDA